MTYALSDIIVSTKTELLDLPFCVGLIKSTSWGAKREPAQILKSIDNSLCFGLYWRDPTTGGSTPEVHKQLGFARIITDRATVGYLCDVIVVPELRGKGLGKFFLSQILTHAEVEKLPLNLHTQTAHRLYEKFGWYRTEGMYRAPKK